MKTEFGGRNAELDELRGLALGRVAGVPEKTHEKLRCSMERTVVPEDRLCCSRY